MTRMRSSPLALLMLCVASASAQAADNGEKMAQGAGPAFFFSRDNESFTTQRLALEYLPKYTHAESLTGVRYTDHHYEQNSWSRNGRQLSFLQRQIDPATANGWQLEAGIFHQGRHDLLTLDANYRAALTQRTSLDLFVSRDWVETAAALDKGVHFTFGGAALDQVLSPRFTLVGLAGIQSFSDGNSRNHGRLKLIFQPDPDLGLTFQGRYRVYTSSSDDVGGAYFNPSRYDESMLAVGWRQRVKGWMVGMTAGVGQQKVASDPRTSTRLLELGLQSPVNNKNYSFRARTGMSQSASFNGPDYRYNYVQGEWIVSF